MTQLSFDAEMGRIQQALAQCHDMITRRSNVLEAVNARSGESVLEVGCGGGFYAYEVAQMVGSAGRVCAVDISEDQIAAAKERCAEFAWADCKAANVIGLPYDNNSFDAVYCVQVLEYVNDINDALREIHRVLRPGGRLVMLATNWSSLVWNTSKPSIMAAVLQAWNTHAPHPDLAAGFLSRTAGAGLQPLGQTPAPILNTSYNENSFSYWLAKMVARFVTGKGEISDDDAAAWLADFDNLESTKDYFFCSTPVISQAIKLA